MDLPEDEEERRRLLAVWLTRGSEAQNAARPALGVVNRLRIALNSQVIRHGYSSQAVTNLLQDPETFLKVVVCVGGGVALLIALVLTLLASDADSNPDAQGLGPTVTRAQRNTTTATGPLPTTGPDGSGSTSANAGSSNTPGSKAGETGVDGRGPGGAGQDGTDGTGGAGAADEVTVDFSGTDYPRFRIPGVTEWTPAGTPRALKLKPGGYTLVAASGNSVPFTVTDRATIDYPSTLDGALTGRGTRTLRLVGRAVSLDFTDTSYPSFDISGWPGWRSPNQVRTLRLLPGRHVAIVPAAGNQIFTVSADGTIDYDPAQDGALSGRGGTVLRAVGSPVGVDLGGTDYRDFLLLGIPGNRANNGVQTYRLLPGTHTIHTPAYTQIAFQVRRGGTIDYPATSNGLLTGRGSPTVRANGLSMTFDLTGSGYTAFQVAGTAGWVPSNQVRSYHLLPGGHTLGVFQGVSVLVIVGANGTWDYAASLDGRLTGRGSTTLVMHR